MGAYLDKTGVAKLISLIKDALSLKADSSSLATVATSGNYNDLTNKPTIPAAQVQSDWGQTDASALDFIKNKPTIPAAPMQSDWNEDNTSSLAFIANKPNFQLKRVVSTTTKSVLVTLSGIGWDYDEIMDSFAGYCSDTSDYNTLSTLLIDLDTAEGAAVSGVLSSTCFSALNSALIDVDSAGDDIPTIDAYAHVLEAVEYRTFGIVNTLAVALPDGATAADEFVFSFQCADNDTTIALPDGVQITNGETLAVLAGRKFIVNIFDGMASLKWADAMLNITLTPVVNMGYIISFGGGWGTVGTVRKYGTSCHVDVYEMARYAGKTVQITFSGNKGQTMAGAWYTQAIDFPTTTNTNGTVAGSPLKDSDNANIRSDRSDGTWTFTVPQAVNGNLYLALTLYPSGSTPTATVVV